MGLYPWPKTAGVEQYTLRRVEWARGDQQELLLIFREQMMLYMAGNPVIFTYLRNTASGYIDVF